MWATPPSRTPPALEDPLDPPPHELSRLRPAQRILLDEAPMTLVAPPGAAEADDDRRQAARLPRAPRERRVARAEEHEVVEVRAAHAERPGLLHEQEVARPAAGGAGPVV